MVMQIKIAFIIMVMSFFYSRSELESSTVDHLRKLVRKHNLHNQIKRYSKMRKAELVEQLLNHSQKTKSAPKKGKAPKRMDKATKALVPELGQPLYKEGLLKGATAQFQKRYGKVVPVKKPAAFIDMTGGRKRTRKPRRRFAIEG